MTRAISVRGGMLQPLTQIEFRYMLPGIKLRSITFNDGKQVPLGPDHILVITGPNNSGKSQVLRDIQGILRTPHFKPTVLSSVEAYYSKPYDQVLSFLHQFMHETTPDAMYFMETGGIASFPQRRAEPEQIEPGNLANTLSFQFLDNETRLSSSNERPIGNLRDRKPRSNLAKLFNRLDRELVISNIFKDAFRIDLILDRTAGGQISLCIGSRSDEEAGGPPFLEPYTSWIKALPRLQVQGDGMRAFATILSETLAEPSPLVMIDEPESFLHPPQVRKIAEVLAKQTDQSTQLIIATHSDDLIRGLLDTASPRMHVARIHRVRSAGAAGTASNDVNPIKILDPKSISELWSDALLRTSNIVSALFHEVAVIVEGEVDARFYRAMIDAMADADRQQASEAADRPRWLVPDLRFYYGTGKGSIAKIVRQLRAVGVPVLAVADIDVLESAGEFRNIVDEFGLPFASVKAEWNALANLMRRERPLNSVAHIEAVIQSVMSAVADRTAGLTRLQRETIIDAVKASASWAPLRKHGESWFSNEMAGAPAERQAELKEAETAFQRLLAAAENVGFFILRKGGVESFSPRDGRKEDWLGNVLQRALAADTELQGAREFIRKLVNTAAEMAGWR